MLQKSFIFTFLKLSQYELKVTGDFPGRNESRSNPGNVRVAVFSLKHWEDRKTIELKMRTGGGTKLWWPNGTGNQSMYTVNVELKRYHRREDAQADASKLQTSRR